MFDRELFKGRTVVITGAGRGIGLATAEAFLAHGAMVIAHAGRSLPKEGPLAEAERQGRARLIAADFLSHNGVDLFANTVQAETDHIDVLINNAGTMQGRFPAEGLTPQQYESVVRLNQTSVVELTTALLPLLKQAKEAAIVNTVSISARTGGSPGSSLYSASKAFISTWSRALARELAPDGIRVNCVSPGTIDTDFHQRYSSAEKLEATRKSIPLQRLGTAEDCAPSYLFLAAASLSGYITGQVLEVNGGQLMA
ncbi:SDR family NAD(P)-dependent oxidoreductase [Rhizobium paknamense]|uniref:NAD(P)-dependent dehydrogenase (Short-subunit alcohol dehydrogenase family) n=1 Tax=Rhizobium paknamense TaxID=1206817 RepID=A0ABU0ICV4_9HYPH|nr:SDR family oxidoreductase [Rhizobium paknamense]MDQ0455512.1 NAD(P)-dependent dehydrogenase (short-subunit alcohol dehydrogenase family) [Rhizobium paknamense]